MTNQKSFILKVKNPEDPTITLSNSLVNFNTPVNTSIGTFTTNQNEIWNFALTNVLDQSNKDHVTQVCSESLNSYFSQVCWKNDN